MFESGMFRARALAAGGRYAAGMLRPVRRSAAQGIATAAAAISNADAGELPADGAQALNLPESSDGNILLYCESEQDLRALLLNRKESQSKKNVRGL